MPMLLEETTGGAAPPPRQGHRPWTRYWNLQSKKPNNVPMTLGEYDCRHTGTAAFYAASRMLCIRENRKRRHTEKIFSPVPFFCFACARGKLAAFPRRFVRKSVRLPSQYVRKQVSRGGTPLALGTGAAEAPASSVPGASFSPRFMRKKIFFVAPISSHTGSRGKAPGAGCGAAEALRKSPEDGILWCGGTGAAEAPAPFPPWFFHRNMI